MIICVIYELVSFVECIKPLVHERHENHEPSKSKTYMTFVDAEICTTHAGINALPTTNHIEPI